MDKIKEFFNNVLGLQDTSRRLRFALTVAAIASSIAAFVGILNLFKSK
jgi:hypothetical protein